MTDRELLQQALDALEYAADEIGCPNDDDSIGIARKALRARLAGWEKLNMNDHKEGDLGIGTVKWDASAPLVVHPHPAFQATQPQRKWVGLTDEEIMKITGITSADSDWNVTIVHKWIRSIEERLKEKNHEGACNRK